MQKLLLDEYDNFRNLTLDAVSSLIENCPNLSSIRYLINWKSITRNDLLEFWKLVRENNVDIELGEAEWMQVSETSSCNKEQMGESPQIQQNCTVSFHCIQNQSSMTFKTLLLDF